MFHVPPTESSSLPPDPPRLTSYEPRPSDYLGRPHRVWRPGDDARGIPLREYLAIRKVEWASDAEGV